MSEQIPYSFGTGSGDINASQIDSNFQYLLGLIQAGNTVISILHSQVSDWTASVQQSIAQYVTSSDGSVNISIRNGLLNFTSTPPASAVQAVISSYLTNTDGSISITNTGGQLNLKAVPPTITHTNVSDFTSASQGVIASYLTSDSTITITPSGGQLHLSATPGTITHANISDFTSAAQGVVQSYLAAADGSIVLGTSGGNLTIRAPIPTITHSNVSDFTSATQAAVLSYLTSADSSITLAQSGGQLTIKANTPTIAHTNVSDFSSASQNVIASYLQSTDGSVTITNTGSNLNLRATPSLTHSSISDFTSATQSAIQSYLTSDGTITFSTSGGQLVLHGVQQNISHTSVSDWSSALQSGVASYIAGDSTITVTQAGGNLNLHVPLPNITHTNVTDWAPALQSSITTILQSTDGSVTFTTNGNNLNVRAPVPALTHTNISDWTSSLQTGVTQYLQGDGTINVTQGVGVLNLHVPTPTISHLNVSDFSSASQGVINAYLTNTDGSITLTQTGGLLNIKAPLPTISHTNVSDWTSALQNAVASYLVGDSSITFTQGAGVLNVHVPTPALTHNNISDYTSATQNVVSSYLINTDGTITLTNNGSTLSMGANFPASKTHAFISDWSSAWQSAAVSTLTSVGNSITLTNNGSTLDLSVNFPAPSPIPHTSVSDWTSALQSGVSGFLTSTNGSVSLTNTGSNLNLSVNFPTLTHGSVTDWTSAVFSTIGGQITSSDNSLNITNTGSQLNLRVPAAQFPSSQAHSYISDWNNAVQNTVSNYLTSSNGSVVFSQSGSQLSLTVPQVNTFPHNAITDWASAVQTTIASYLTCTDGSLTITNTGSSLNFHVVASGGTSSISHTQVTDWTSAVEGSVAGYIQASSPLTLTNTGTVLQLGLGALTHTSITDWTSATFASLAGQIESSNGTISIANTGTQLNLGMVAQAHGWITDWTSAVQNTVINYLTSANQSITFTTTGSGQLSLQVASAGGTGYTISTNPSPITVVSGSAQGTQIATLSTSGFSGPYTYSIVNPSGRYQISGSALQCGAVATDYTQIPNDSVTIQSVGAGGASVSQTFSITVNPPSGSGTSAAWDFNFVSQSYSGASLSALNIVQPTANLSAPDHTGTIHYFAANTLRITDLGLTINPNSTVFAGWYDTTPMNWGYTPYTVGPATHYANWVSRTAQAVDGIFTPALYVFQDTTGERLVPGSTAADFPQGTVTTIAFRVKPTGSGAAGVLFKAEWLTASGATYNNQEVYWTNITTSGTPTLYPSGGSGLTWLSTTQPETGVYEVLMTWTVQGDSSTPVTPTISLCVLTGDNGAAISSSNTGSLIIYGMSWVVGSFNSALYAGTVGAASTVAGDQVTLTGALATWASGGTGTIMLEIDSISASYLPTGHTNAQAMQVGSTDVLSINSYCSISNLNEAQTVPVGIGGMQGITRLCFAWDNTGYSMCVNGGLVGHYSTVPTMSGTITLFKTLAGRCRRMTGYNNRQSDANLQVLSQIYNRTLINPGNSLALGSTTQTFFDDFLANSIRTWNTSAGANSGGGPTTATYPWSPTVGPNGYQISRTDGAGVYNGGAGANWLPRYCVEGSYGTGSSLPGNGEFEWYADPSYPWQSGWSSPFAFSGSQLSITARQISGQGSGNIAIYSNTTDVPAPTSNVTSAGFSYYPWTSGVLTSAGVSEQQHGYWEIRCTAPWAGACWPAFWLLPGSTPNQQYTSLDEIDIFEAFGTINTDYLHSIYSYGTTVHWNNYSGVAYDLAQYTPQDKSTHFNTYGMLWRSGQITFYQNGTQIFAVNSNTGVPDNGYVANGGSIVTSGTGSTNIESLGTMYILIDFAVGGYSAGTPTGAEQGQQMVIDYVGVWS